MLKETPTSLLATLDSLFPPFIQDHSLSGVTYTPDVERFFQRIELYATEQERGENLSAERFQKLMHDGFEDVSHKEIQDWLCSISRHERFNGGLFAATIENSSLKKALQALS